jgi:hypothetical protein
MTEIGNVIYVKGWAGGLKAGDTVYADQKITTGDYSVIAIQLNNGKMFDLGSNGKAILDAEVYQTDEVNSLKEESTLNVDSVIAKLKAGNIDAINELEATAAGPTASPIDDPSESADLPVIIARTGAIGDVTAGYETNSITYTFNEIPQEDGINILDILSDEINVVPYPNDNPSFGDSSISTNDNRQDEENSNKGNTDVVDRSSDVPVSGGSNDNGDGRSDQDGDVDDNDTDDTSNDNSTDDHDDDTDDDNNVDDDEVEDDDDDDSSTDTDNDCDDNSDDKVVEHGNNGWGNGDQDPPGNSGDHNQAENSDNENPLEKENGNGNNSSNNDNNSGNSGNSVPAGNKVEHQDNGYGNGDDNSPRNSGDNNNAENQDGGNTNGMGYAPGNSAHEFVDINYIDNTY